MYTTFTIRNLCFYKRKAQTTLSTNQNSQLFSEKTFFYPMSLWGSFFPAVTSAATVSVLMPLSNLKDASTIVAVSQISLAKNVYDAVQPVGAYELSRVSSAIATVDSAIDLVEDAYYKEVTRVANTLIVARKAYKSGNPITAVDGMPIVEKMLRLKHNDVETDVDAMQCVVCMQNGKAILFRPCLHCACCLSCTKSLLPVDKPSCPVCRTEIADVETIFLSN